MELFSIRIQRTFQLVSTYIASDNPEQISAGKNENKPRYF